MRFFPCMMVADTRLVSDDFQVEGWSNRLLYIDQSHLAPAIREQVIKEELCKANQDVQTQNCPVFL